MKAPASWAPQETTRFHRAFLKYGAEWDKVSKSVGGGKSPEACEALYSQHRAFLSLDRQYQSEVAFVAMVEDAMAHQLKEEPASSGRTGGGEEGDGPAAAGASTGGLQGESQGGAAGKAEGQDVAMEEGEAQQAAEDGEGGAAAAAAGGTLAATRPRRTPKRSVLRTPPGSRSTRRTPQSSSKRQRAAALRDDDIYEYYDTAPGAGSESSRKRRASAKRLEFGGGGGLGLASGPVAAAGGRRREAAEEAKGIDALLSLAVAGEEFEGGGLGADEEEEPPEGLRAPPQQQQQQRGEEEEEEGGKEEEGEEEAHAGGLAAAAAAAVAAAHEAAEAAAAAGPPSQGRRARAKREARGESASLLEEEELDEPETEDEEEAGALDDADDEDYEARGERSRRRRTPTSTPLRTRSRPGSTHVTPRRTGSRGMASPGLRGLGSPAWLGLSDTELGTELGIPDLSYLSSPGFMGLPPGYVPSPKNPMPRLRRRKYAPTKSPPVVSPFKSLFGSRRQSLAGGPPAPSLLFGAAGGYSAAAAAAAAASGEDASSSGVMTPAEVQLRHCLNARTRRWCQFEFFYSAIDRPWFMEDGMQAWLAHLGLSSTSKLTRKEWSLVRAGLGKPRRLSLGFLREERARLEAWRESVRAHYAVVGAPGAPPVDQATAAGFPQPLSVGQRVTARHPTTHQLHDGSVLTAAPNCYRIQFDRRELGVELVRDCDIMPADPAENLPTALLTANPLLLLNGRYIVGGQPVRPPAPRTIFPLTFSAIPTVTPAAAGPFPRAPAQQPQQIVQPVAPLLAQQQQGAAAALLAAASPPEAPGSAAGAAADSGAAAPGSTQRAAVGAAEAQALSELAVSLDKKEALLVQLRAMNDEAAAGVHAVPGGEGGAGGDTSQAFKLAYARVVLQLRDTNERVASKLVELEALRNAEAAGAREGVAAGPGGGSSDLAAAPPAAPAAAAVVPPAPETAESLAGSALQEARAMAAACRQKLAEAAAEASRRMDAGADAGGQPPQQPPAQPLDWDAPPGRLLGGVIEGCVWSLLALQKGCAGSAPAATLAGALDTALHAARPHAAANHELYAEIRQAMDALRAQLLVA